ncbi:MAG: SigB/SigF/SigG family RNA polymerase sigma factor [Actinomycetota bacterium]|nr:SigB/SigF/SigG family RNA polymerase sigma factor [Actinomycetota bacterium]
MSAEPVEPTTSGPARARRRRRASSSGRDELAARLLSEAGRCDGDAERRRLLDEVIVLHLDVARSIASRYRGRGEPIEDLEQVAYVGLAKAVHRFEPDYGKSFLSYAVPTVSGEVKKHFRDCSWAVRPPRRIQDLQGKIAACASELHQELAQSPTASQIARSLGAPIDDVTEALASNGCFTPTSLDHPVGARGTSSLGDLLGCEDPDLARTETHITLAPLIRALPDRDRLILNLRFFHDQTQTEIADQLGVTQMQVSRLIAGILQRIRLQLDA